MAGGTHMRLHDRATPPLRKEGQRRRFKIGIAGSALLHVIALLVAGFIFVASPLPEQREAVHVTLLNPDLPKPPPPTAVAPDETSSPASSPPQLQTEARSEAPNAPAAPPSSEVQGMVTATHMRSAAVLADPRSAGARAALKTLDPDTRIEQVCNLEAMEQVRQWKAGSSPDYLVAYAMEDTKRTGAHLHADGAAIRISDHWYRFRYACTVGSDETVTRFAFALGAEIPRTEWSDHGLVSSRDEGAD